jgi:DNA-binding response OmpR family regulator
MKNGKYVILCIDDDQDLLDSMKIILESRKYTVETANSAEEGLRRYKTLNPDLILVDLMMEEVDAGTSFVRDIRAIGPTPPVYMLSSVGDNLNQNTSYSDLGLTGVLQKPVDPDTLLRTVSAKLK